MRGWRVVYWFVTGAFLGLGLDILVLGTCFLAGWILLLFGGVARPGRALRGREAVATVLGLGVGLATILPLVAYTPPVQGGLTVVPLWYAGLVVSILILVGLVALVVVWRTPRRGAGPNRHQGV